MAKRNIATLLTDFGLTDPYVAAMKGVILSASPQAQIVDISHSIAPQDILAAAFILAQAAPYFPPETLHVVVVDPGVGTDRHILIARFGGRLFLFPDNGVITFVAERLPLEAVFTVSNTRYLPATAASRTFHGRDIFAPVAGHILNGLEISKLGPVPESYKLLDLPVASEQAGRIAGQVIYVDCFGNLVSNISELMLRKRFKELDRLRIECAGLEVGPLQGAYGFVGQGEPLALIDSMNYVEIAVNCSRACEHFDVGVGAEVIVTES